MVPPEMRAERNGTPAGSRSLSGPASMRSDRMLQALDVKLMDINIKIRISDMTTPGKFTVATERTYISKPQGIPLSVLLPLRRPRSQLSCQESCPPEAHATRTTAGEVRLWG